MECERKVNLGEGVPLNTECSTNIILNTGPGKINSSSAAVIQLKSNEKSPHDVGLHIHNTLSIMASKKIKFLFISSAVLSAVCIAVTTSVALYYWRELASLQLQINEVQDRLITSSLKNQMSRALDPVPSAQGLTWNERLPRQDTKTYSDSPPPSRHFYVDGLEEDLHFAPGSRRGKTEEKKTDVTVVEKQDAVVAHFVGAGLEKNLGNDPYVGPWQADHNSSSKDFAKRMELVDHRFVKVHDGGLYLIYAQLVYVTNAPNCFLLWVQDELSSTPESTRLLSTCATGDVSGRRPLRNSQISCTVQTVARLNKGDLINFAQREKNSTVYLHPGASYFGFIKLSS